MKIRPAPAALLLALAACSDGGVAPPLEGGVMTATLRSPNGAEGAAVVELSGAGIQSVDAAAGATVFAEAAGGVTRVVVLRATPGALAFRVTMADGAPAPDATVVEVADGSDVPRASLSGYRVEFAR